MVTSVVSFAVVFWEVWSLNKHLSSMSVGLTAGQHLHSPYIYLSDSKAHLIEKEFWIPWLHSKSTDAWTLLHLCKSELKSTRLLGVRLLASEKSWESYQYRFVAQAADYRTLIGLAHSQGSDPRFFLPQPALVPSKKTVAEELANLLIVLCNIEDETCINTSNPQQTTLEQNTCRKACMLAEHYLETKDPTADEKDMFWYLDSSTLDVTIDRNLPIAENLELIFLHTIKRLINKQEQAAVFMRNHGLATLQRVNEMKPDQEVAAVTAAILGNLAAFSESEVHQSVVHAGWLGVLKKWSEDENVTLALLAHRALANLDRDWSADVFGDGVFLLYPLYRSKKTVHADIVFIHGLLGGAIKTWRQQDLPVPAPADSPSQVHTACWPKDWLAEDCPHARILSLHYDTSLSTWSGQGSDRDKRTLEGRSKDMLEKLRQAGVGSRPIIWVGHSMGGLLIKQMLELAEGDTRYSTIQTSTCGLLFYGVPHHGLSWAALSSQAHYLLYPSVEVQELSRDSKKLQRLHSHFQNFVRRKNIPCLSFGETLKTKISKTLPKILLVSTQSSDPGVGEFQTMPLNHINICKPSSRESVLYEQTLAFIQRCMFLSLMDRIRQGVMGDTEETHATKDDENTKIS